MSASGASSGNELHYTGRENDGTGLYYYRARYYHPGLQRFISEDPLGFNGGDVDLYAYVWNGPSNFIDPSGEWGFGVTGGGSSGGRLWAGGTRDLSGGSWGVGGDS